MQTALHEYLLGQPVLTLFLVLGCGYLIGNIKVFGISLGAVGGVLLAGLVFGNFGFSINPGAQSFGFVLFIFCVGYQAGPQFFDVLMTDGLKYLSLALVIAATGFGLSVILARALDFAPGMVAGLMGGAMTTTPTLAAAQDAVTSGLVTVPADSTAEQILTNIGAAYALTYLFGLIGLILVIRLLPMVLRIDLPAEAAKLQTGNDPEAGPDLSKVTRRTYRVTRAEKLGRTIAEMEVESKRQASIVAIRRDGAQIPVEFDTRLELGDEVLVIGNVEHMLQNAPELGEEIADEEGLALGMETAQVVVSNADLVGKPLASIRLDERSGALALEVKRHGTSLPMNDDLVLHRGDVISVYGPGFAIDQLVHLVGHVERDVSETDLFTFALGCAAGIGLGALTVNIGGLSIGLGMAGGLLITGLLIGYLRSIWPVFGRVPSGARWVLME